MTGLKGRKSLARGVDWVDDVGVSEHDGAAGIRASKVAMVLGIGAWHGRLYLGSGKMADQSLGSGTVLPASVHGGPGRAGGGEERCGRCADWRRASVARTD